MVKKQWTKEDEIALINSLQDKYVDQLIELINSTKSEDAAMKQVNLTSPTGTGKTKMMAKLMNKYPDAFFMVTTLSKGQLHKQVETSLSKDCLYDNYIVFGAMSLKINSILTEQNIIDLLPADKDIYWIRDEGHINTNKWSKVLETRCKKIINFSATNKIGYGITCNFVETMMLRTVHQSVGYMSDTLKKLIEIKKAHKGVKKYNPCAIFKVTTDDTEENIIALCQRYKLNVITLVDNDDYIMSDICKDDNKYDVIINKQKIVEGIDIRRAHVIWMENKPKNTSTTIQAIGRCRRNALLWREDIDILDNKNKELLQQTRKCFVFYNIDKTKLETDEDGELIVDLCPIISVERLHPNCTIYVEDGVMPNGLIVAELENQTGYFKITIDDETGFNIVNNPELYTTQCGLYRCFYPDIDSLVSKLLDKDSVYFKNLYNSLLPYLDGAPFYKYSANKTEKPGYIYYHITDRDDIDCNGVMPLRQKTVERDFDYLNYIARTINLIMERTDETFVQLNKEGGVRPDNYIILTDTNGCKYKVRVNYLCDLINKVSADKDIDAVAVRRTLLDPQELMSVEEHDYADAAVWSNKLISLLGIEDFEQHKLSGHIIWLPTKSVTSKITSHTKLNRLINNTYADKLSSASLNTFTGHNTFGFSKALNSCLGWSVEYYAKYLLFGPEFLGDHITNAMMHCHLRSYKKEKDLVIIRACLLKYKEDVRHYFGELAYDKIKVPTVMTLRKKESSDFINTVIQLGTKTADFARAHLDINAAKKMNHAFNTKHIVGMADFMDHNTIIDLKCTNYIDNQMLRQVLAYHLLSQFRPDLDIKKVIVYDAVSGKFIEIDLTDIKE